MAQGQVACAEAGVTVSSLSELLRAMSATEAAVGMLSWVTLPSYSFLGPCMGFKDGSHQEAVQ